MKIIIFLNLYAKFIEMESAESQDSLYISHGNSLTLLKSLLFHTAKKNIYIFSFHCDLDQTGQILAYGTSPACLIHKITP